MNGFKIFLRRMGALVKLSLLELWRRHDIFVLLVLALVLLVPLSMARPFDVAGATRYFDEAAFLLIWAFSLFIGLGTGGRLFASEFSNRTIYPLLAKPVSRGHVLFGKYLGAVIASWSALAFFYVLFAVSSYFRGGEGVSACLLQAFVLHAACVAVIVAAAVLGSFLATPAASATLCAILFPAMFFFGRRLPDYAQNAVEPIGYLVWLFYWTAPHAEFFDMRQRVVHGWGCVDGLVFLVVLAYAAVYVGLLLAAARFALNRKSL